MTSSKVWEQRRARWAAHKAARGMFSYVVHFVPSTGTYLVGKVWNNAEFEDEGVEEFAALGQAIVAYPNAVIMS